MDDSFTTKVMYSIGMTNKPKVVSDSALDGMAGKEIFRCVSDSSNPRMKAKDIIEQVRTGDYTRMSDSGGSVYGRALYFADQYGKSATFGKGLSSVVMRAKVDPKAKIVAESTLIKK